MKRNQTFPCSKYCKDESPVYINDGMTGKMEDIPCIGTTCKLNNHCQKRVKKAIEEGNLNCICLKCYAKKTLSMYEKLEKRSEENYKLLNSTIISEDLLPVFKRFVDVARIEPFGDADSVECCLNYIHIIKANPKVMFMCPTKNPELYEEAFRLEGKPENVIMVLSSVNINEVAKVIYPWIDIVFTVWESEKKCNEKGFEINCGKKKCYDCMHCYTKGNGQVRYVHEIKK